MSPSSEFALNQTACVIRKGKPMKPDDSDDYDDRPRRRREPDDRDDDFKRQPAPRRPPARMSVKAVFSLILGLLSFCLSPLVGVPAVILGLLGLRDVNRSGGRVVGSGLAIAGIVTGGLGSLVSLALIAVTIGLAVPAVRQAQARVKTSNDLKQIAMAFHNYHDTFHQFPGPAVPAANGRPGPRNLSWRVTILPYLEESPLYQQFNLDEPWDSPDNIKLLKRMPKVYRSPEAPDDSTTTRYRVFVGGGAMFDWDRPTRMADVKDGLSNTILVVEAGEAVPWTKPDELEYSPTRPLPKLGRGSAGKFTAVAADGMVHFIDRDAMSERDLRNLITRADGMLVPEW
jgi:hypothetical protein